MFLGWPAKMCADVRMCRGSRSSSWSVLGLWSSRGKTNGMVELVIIEFRWVLVGFSLGNISAGLVHMWPTRQVIILAHFHILNYAKLLEIKVIDRESVNDNR